MESFSISPHVKTHALNLALHSGLAQGRFDFSPQRVNFSIAPLRCYRCKEIAADAATVSAVTLVFARVGQKKEEGAC